MVGVFFKSIKAELIWCNKWGTRRQAEGAIFHYKDLCITILDSFNLRDLILF